MSDWIDSPEASVDTPCGALRLVVHGAISAYDDDTRVRHAVALTDGARHDAPASNVTINGVEYSLRVDLMQDAGGWVIAHNDADNRTGWHSISGTRADWMSRRGSNSYDASQLSDAARRKVREVIVPALTDYLNDHPDMIAAADRASGAQAAHTLRDKVTTARDELATLEARLERAETMARGEKVPA